MIPLIILAIPGLIIPFIKKFRIDLKEVHLFDFVCVILSLLLTAFKAGAEGDYINIYKLVPLLFVTIPAAVTLLKLLVFIKDHIPLFNASQELPFDTKLSVKELLVTAAASFVSILISSTSSPLYPFNFWDDTNLFFTMGRGIVNGLIPYKDLYEQKGPVLYFIHALCALISSDTFIGVFLLECLMGFIFLLFTYKIIRLFVKIPKGSAAVYIIIPFAAAIYTSNMFHFGGSCEELSLGLISIVIYISLKALCRKDKLPSFKETFEVGMITAFLFFMKFTLCITVAGFLIFFFVYAIRIKEGKKLLLSILSCLGGFILLSLPVIFYFLINNALKDLITSYFYNNIFLYSNVNSASTSYYDSIFLRLFRILVRFGLSFAYNPGLLFILALSLFSFPLLPRKARGFYLLSFLLSFSLLMGLDYVIFYYGFALMAFTAPSAALLAALSQSLGNHIKIRPRILKIAGIGLCLILSFSFFITAKNLPLMKLNKEDMPQFIFARDMAKKNDPKILTYDVMDDGFFTSSGTLPSNKYFCFLNIEDTLPDILEEQNRLIEEGYFDYIITYDADSDFPGYVKIDGTQMDFPSFDGKWYYITHYLYEKEATR